MGVTVHYEMNTSICGTTERPPDQPCQQMFKEAATAADAVMARTGIAYRITQHDQRDADKSETPFYGIIVEIDAEIDAPDQPGQTGRYELAYGWRWEDNGYETLPGPDGLSRFRARPPVWYGGTWCKTAGADDWLPLHLSIVTIVETWKEWELVSSMRDEAHWHPDHNPLTLVEERGFTQEEIESCLERLGLQKLVRAPVPTG